MEKMTCICRGFGLYLFYMPRPSKDERNKEIIRKYQKGWSLREIGEFFNLHHSTVDEILKRWLPIMTK